MISLGSCIFYKNFMVTVYTLYSYIRRHALLLALPLLTFLSQPSTNAQSYSNFGYSDLGDSVEFVFGQQQKIKIGGIDIVLQKRINEITSVNVAGDFNEWNADANKYQMSKVDAKNFKLRVSKTNLGKKGERRQFKFVLNHKYWVEPPVEALNKFKGADGNTNLLVRILQIQKVPLERSSKF